MTERGKGRIARTARAYTVGPSSLLWDGQSLHVDINEIAVPLPRRVRGQVRITPRGLSRFVTALDGAGKHRWGPISPCATVEVQLQAPQLTWRGHAYLDSNEGDEPIDTPFAEWDWSRATLSDGSCAVIYDVRHKDGTHRVIARRFRPDGQDTALDAPTCWPLPRTRWGLQRSTRASAQCAPQLLQPMEDTPFYARALVQSQLCGERVVAVHETLSLPRLVSLPVRLMLPWRMPRRP